ncbi:MAG: MFS transporter, partial [Giesbergeria sp.]
MSPTHPAARADTSATFPAALWLIPGVYFLFVAAEFVVLTRLALTLTAQGASALAVGALASAFWVGIFVASTAAHALVQRLGHARCFLAAMAVSALAVASLLPHDTYAGWLAAAALMGLGGGLVWVSGEAWLAEAAPRERRGLLIGLFETSVGLGMLAGPALLPLSLWAGVSPLGVALVLMAAGLACAWPLLYVAEPAVDAAAASADAAGARQGWREFAVPLAAVVVVSGLLESGVSSLLPSIAMRLGFAMD